ncbi:hypothetical protein D3C86_1516450 [compost metagenome]
MLILTLLRKGNGILPVEAIAIMRGSNFIIIGCSKGRNCTGLCQIPVTVYRIAIVHRIGTYHTHTVDQVPFLVDQWYFVIVTINGYTGTVILEVIVQCCGTFLSDHTGLGIYGIVIYIGPFQFIIDRGQFQVIGKAVTLQVPAHRQIIINRSIITGVQVWRTIAIHIHQTVIGRTYLFMVRLYGNGPFYIEVKTEEVTISTHIYRYRCATC